jgi:hypothetical protein
VRVDRSRRISGAGAWRKDLGGDVSVRGFYGWLRSQASGGNVRSEVGN